MLPSPSQDLVSHRSFEDFGAQMGDFACAAPRALRDGTRRKRHQATPPRPEAQRPGRARGEGGVKNSKTREHAGDPIGSAEPCRTVQRPSSERHPRLT